jgi:hypothetical protein
VSQPSDPPPGSTDYLWTFGRGVQRVEIRRYISPNGPILEVVGGDAPGTTAFNDMAGLVAYQSALETRLLASGWTLIAFSPERRSGKERRAAARGQADRRRWWTDAEFRRRDK